MIVRNHGRSFSFSINPSFLPFIRTVMYTIKSETEIGKLTKAELITALLAAQAFLSAPEDKQLAELQKQLEDSNQAKEKAEAKATALEKTVIELNSELSKAETAAPKSSREISIGGKSYEMIAGSAKYQGKEITLEVLKADKKLAEELVSIGAGFLVVKN